MPVLPKVGGFVSEVAVREHQAVKAGDLLLSIDDRDYRTRRAQAEADLTMALANAGTAGQSGQAGAQVAAARAALAQLQASRQTALSAGEQVTATNAGLRAALAKVDAARAVRDLAANQLADTRIVAPVGGVIAARNVERGQLVQAGQSLMSVVPLDEIWIVANFKETDLRDLKPGAPAEIEIDAYPGKRLSGQVESLSPATGARFALLPPDNATGNFTKVVQRVPVRIHLSQSDDAQRPLRPGMSAAVSISTR